MRYQKIHTSIWDDEEFRGLSDQAQRLCLWLMTNRFTNIAGVYRLSFAILHDEYRTQKSQKQFRRCTLRELLDSVVATKMIYRCPDMQLIAIKGQYRHNPISNDKQVISAVRVIESLPKSPIYQYIDIKPLNKPYHKPLLSSLSKRLSIYPSLSFTEEEAVTEEGVVDNVDNSPPLETKDKKNKHSVFTKKLKEENPGEMPKPLKDILPEIKEPKDQEDPEPF